MKSEREANWVRVVHKSDGLWVKLFPSVYGLFLDVECSSVHCVVNVLQWWPFYHKPYNSIPEWSIDAQNWLNPDAQTDTMNCVSDQFWFSNPQAKHGKSPPGWVTPDVMETLKVLKNFGFQIMFGVYKRKEKCKLQGGESLSPPSYSIFLHFS